jgi:alkylation response protein AidB-like acyl-CoA dehydrogenase
MLGPSMFRFDPVELPPSARALREEVRDFLKGELKSHDLRRGFDPEFSRKMGAKGWLGMTWVKPYGRERPQLERYVVIEEMLAAGAPVSAHWTADRQSGPNILRFGTQEQKDFFLPKIAAGEMYFCIGMSEPDSGSDLAAARTRAEKVEGGFVVNGTKLWTSNAHRAHFIILFCKTSRDADDRHAGATQLLIDLKTPGIKINPVINMAGNHDFNEVVFTDVFVPDSRLLGTIGGGWRQVMSELGFERSGPERFLSSFRLLTELVRVLGPNPSAGAAREIGRLVAQLAALRRMSLSVQGMLQAGTAPDVAAAVVKDVGTQFEQDIPEVARQLVETEPTLGGAEFEQVLAHTILYHRSFSIRGGTREILRGIIARGLGLR